MIRADTELRYLKGVGPRRALGLAGRDLVSVEDLLYVMPTRYEDRRSFARVADLAPLQPESTLSVKIVSSRLIRTRRKGFTIFRAEVADDSGSFPAVWFNQPYLERVLVAGRNAVLYGRVAVLKNLGTVLHNPESECLVDDDAEGMHTGRIVPVYRQQAELTSRMLRRVLYQALAELDPHSLNETVPRAVAERHGLMGRMEALREVHFPPCEVSVEELDRKRTAAQRSLVFEEMFLLQRALALRRRTARQARRGISYEVSDALRARLAGLLPFELTAAQERVLREIEGDLCSDHPMQRLLQGDVGSGKTIVALLTLLVAIGNGYQGVLMVPTEILAEQHMRNIRALLGQGGIDCRTCLLTGSLRAGPRRRTLERIRNGDANLVIGTHALFEPGVEFSRLGLVVIDEQHRFGVLQRAALSQKGSRPDVLVMTATPIPRSMALTIYGDLDLSQIDELPPGRTPISTVMRNEFEREKVYGGLRLQIEKGRQAYVVVPLVEETERSDRKAAEAFARKLSEEVFPDLAVGMIHGRLKGEEKDRVMQAFAAGEIQILVATTVIEVGVDVPNATVMIIEHAERFGLSQLHQLRGRVGRGSERSYCILMIGGEDHGRDARERLKIMTETSDGFRIAERDLELRGAGAVFGTQQHGLGDLQFVAQAVHIPGLLDAARGEARRLVNRERRSRQAARGILEALGGKWKRRLELARVG